MQPAGVPFYFGSGERRLFGIYHPAHRPMGNRGVVVCAPTGLDYIRSHRAFQRLSAGLAERGLHTLRFDYYGCGDSAGRGDEPTIEDWRSDLRSAIEELRDMSGVKRLSLFGARLGGALAAMQGSDGMQIDKLALWDPVVKGRHYLDCLADLHKRTLSDSDRFTKPRTEDKGDYRHQLMGFTITPVQRLSIVELDLTAVAITPARRVLMVVSDDRVDYLDYAAALRADGVELDFRHLAGVGNWERLDRMGHVLFPVELVKIVVEWLAEEP